jgi:hypothetical protein
MHKVYEGYMFRLSAVVKMVIEILDWPSIVFDKMISSNCFIFTQT